VIVAILMGRKGSKGFPGKNLYPVLGNPLAYYPMKAAKDCSEVDKVYISTESTGIHTQSRRGKKSEPDSRRKSWR